MYEQPSFHELCDELGIMVWQDFMFANMQYPIDDEDSPLSVLPRRLSSCVDWRRHPSTVVFCGGSEVEQQAAMMGAPAEATAGHQLGSVLAGHRAQRDRRRAYVTNSPSGGPLPFSVSAGVAHYFGVGAYLRPLEDARQQG